MKAIRNNIYYILAVLIPSVLVFLLSQGCLQSDAAGELCLGWATPYVNKLRPIAGYLGGNVKPIYQAELPWFYGFVLFVSVISFLRKRYRWGVFWLLTALPILGEGYVLTAQPERALVCHLAGLGLLAIFWFFSKQIDDHAEVVAPKRSWELGAFLVLIVALLGMRFYALNRIPATWDTELCIFRLFASSWDRIWQHESGWSPQTSTGLSWLLFTRFVGHVDEPDIYYLLHRTVGVFLSVLKVVVLFLFMRNVFGRFPAFLAAALLAFGPPEDWWARVPNFHHWPGIVTVLIIWATISAMQKPTWKRFLVLTLLSGFSRFVYPSGMFMVFVPVTFFGSLLVFQWSQWRPHFGKICILLIGLAFWCEWLSICRALYTGRWETLPPIIIPSHSEMSGGLLAKLYHIFIENGADLFSNIYFKQSSSTHWTVVQSPAPWRSVPSVVAVISILAFARTLGSRRDKISWLLLIACFFAAVPGITSAVADRRVGAIFIILIILAAREAGKLADFMQRTLGTYLVRLLQCTTPIALAVYLGAIGGSQLFFSNQGLPRQVAIGKVFRDNMKDNHLLVDLTGQLKCDLFYSVYREMKDRACRAGFVSSQFEGNFTPTLLLENPRFDKSIWWYPLTELAACTEWPEKKWEAATFIITETPEAQKWLSQLRVRYPQGKEEALDISYMPYQKETLMIFRTTLP